MPRHSVNLNESEFGQQIDIKRYVSLNESSEVGIGRNRPVGRHLQVSSFVQGERPRKTKAFDVIAALRPGKVSLVGGGRDQ